MNALATILWPIAAVCSLLNETGLPCAYAVAGRLVLNIASTDRICTSYPSIAKVSLVYYRYLVETTAYRTVELSHHFCFTLYSTLKF